MSSNPPVISKIEKALEKKLADIGIKRTEEEYASRAKKSKLPFSSLKKIPIDSEALALLDEETARSAGLAIIFKSLDKLTVAILDPKNKNTQKILDDLKKEGNKLDVIVTSPKSMEDIWGRYSNIRKTPAYQTGTIEVRESELEKLYNQISNVSELKSRFSRTSTTELLETLLAGGLKIGASDIHLEPETNQTKLRYRLDGLLSDITTIDKYSYEKLIGRVKVLSKMRLNIHNTAQDGRFTIKLQSTDIEVRISVLPSEFGETIVMRLLDPRTVKPNLEDLGMRKDLLEIVEEQLTKPTGSILTTGPTGAGKTTTLYAFVNHLNTPGTKIITIEDPIEYHLTGTSQTQIDPSGGYTFANGLRAIVRQDPDIILVGEIRDAETAEIALHAALTGHLVLSTIHTNNASGTIPRLIDLGINPQIIAPAVNMAMGQRLLRKLCIYCKVKTRVSKDILDKIKEKLDPIKEKIKIDLIDESLGIYEASQCQKCNGLGYKGRVGVFEAFVVSKTIEKLILTSPAISEIEELAIKEGMITMLQDAYLKLLDGTTSIDEIKRILGS